MSGTWSVKGKRPSVPATLGKSVAALTLALPLSWAGSHPAFAQTDEPEIPEVEMTIHVTAPVGFDDGGKFYVGIAALGPPPSGSATLVDSGGRNAATVSSAPGQCQGDQRLTGLGTDEWCLRISGLGAGSDVVGSVTTSQMTLKLTVGERHNFFWLPLLVTLGSFVLALVVAWWTTIELGRGVARNRVQAEVDQNSRDRVIEGLGEWVTDQRVALQETDLLPIVLAIRRSGPRASAKARIRLGQALTSSPLPATHALRVAAKQEADRQDNRMEDFYSGATKREKHPADETIGLLNTAQLIWQRLRRAEAIIGTLTPDGTAGLRELLRNADDVLAQAKDAAGLSFAEKAESEVWRKLADMIVSGEHPRLDEALAAPERPEGGDLTVDSLDRRVLPLPLPPLLPRIGLPPALPLIEAGLLTAGTVLLLALIAAVSVASANWIPNATFGTWPNYLALALSAFASTAVAGILAVLVLWRTPAPAKK